jgi:hypothetical protein
MRSLRFIAAALATAGALSLSALPAAAKLLIQIDKSSQTMTVSEDGARLYTWPVSTGVARYDTPGGSYTPFRMERDHYSKEWDDAPMPNSIFFTKRGHAIHGTNHTSIGRPASHGCVRLSVEHSRVLFDLVKREGMANTKVVLFGEIPLGNAPEMVRRQPQPQFSQPGYGFGYGNDDDEYTSPLPQRRVYRSDDDRSTYWGSRERPIYSDRDTRYARPAPPPPPFFLRGPRWNYD